MNIADLAYDARRVVPGALFACVPGLKTDGHDFAAAAVNAGVPGYHIAGKTGTAAKPDEDGGYSDYRYVASFVGFVPAAKPRLVILVTVDEPRGAIWGGTVAAPAFAEIAKFALQYLEVPPAANAAG